MSHLLHAAVHLTEAINHGVDKSLPEKLAGIVKTHAALAVGSAFVPVPGADIAAATVNVWAMYARINNELGLPFGENVIKSVASGVVTNIGAAAAGLLIAGSVLKFIPGLGSVGGAAVMATSIYAITLASGIVYMKAITHLLKSKTSNEFSEADLRSATNQVMQDKDTIKTIIQEGRQAYKHQNGQA